MANRPPKVALPGEMYQKNGRWWWKVRLPGEPRVRARALKPDGARVAAKTRKVAEAVACEMWRLSIEAETEARVKAEFRAKADRAIAKARAEAADTIARVQADCNEQLAACAQALAKAQERAGAEAEQRAQIEAEARAMAEARAEARTGTEPGYGRVAEDTGNRVPCEGCGQHDVPEHELAKIDSGQLVCQDCLMLIRA